MRSNHVNKAPHDSCHLMLIDKRIDGIEIAARGLGETTPEHQFLFGLNRWVNTINHSNGNTA